MGSILPWSILLIVSYSLTMMVSSERLSPRGVSSPGSTGTGAPRRGLLLAPRTSHYNTRLSDGFVIRDDDVIELTKKQFDDYGHMRFGKREDQFDDYGHLRFGRADAD